MSPLPPPAPDGLDAPVFDAEAILVAGPASHNALEQDAEALPTLGLRRTFPDLPWLRSCVVTDMNGVTLLHERR